MSTDKQVADKISGWLEAEAPMRLPDRVLRATFERTRTTRQQRGWRALLGRIHVNRLVPMGLATAAVVGAVFIGAQLFGSPGDGGVGGAPSATPSPTAQPSPSPDPSVAAPSSPADGGLPVGSSYVLISGGGVRGTVTVPAPGWFGGGGIMTRDNVDPPAGAGMITFVGEPLYVYGDPCDWSTTKPETPATTVDELVAAMAAQASRDASEPVAITVGGYAGKSITLHVPDDAVFSECDQGYFGSWGVPSESTPARYHQGPGQIDELWILDVDGVLTVIDTAYYEGTPAEHVAELRAIVESITFE